jgi:hypothetical protein
MRAVLQDGRYTFRLWARHPLHTVFMIAALAIGIGATTGGFSVVNTLLLSSLPFHDPERLASFHPNEFIPPHDSSKQFHDWREQSTYLANAALSMRATSILVWLTKQFACTQPVRPGIYSRCSVRPQPWAGRSYLGRTH